MPGSYEDNVFFIGDFDDTLEQYVVSPLTAEILKQAKEKDGRIDLWITSYGGYVHLATHLVELVEYAKRQGVTVRTIVPSTAFSAGSMLAIAGTPGERYIGRNADHLIHYGQIGSAETTEEQIKRYTKWKTKMFRANIAHYEKYANVPDLANKISDDGYFVTAAEAIRWKMADKYIEKLD